MSATEREVPRLAEMTAHLMEVDRGVVQSQVELEPPPPNHQR